MRAVELKQVSYLHWPYIVNERATRGVIHSIFVFGPRHGGKLPLTIEI